VVARAGLDDAVVVEDRGVSVEAEQGAAAFQQGIWRCGLGMMDGLLGVGVMARNVPVQERAREHSRGHRGPRYAAL
jgi:hypothetical protein